ncbi:hypothetical protein QUF61_07825 [Candidatus Venteria ishoeyi]|uniref:hypothetical protein n=1 Tax=Candidatus Venteria ishoeyi TaxID=1899563 RepID=UPI0025A60DD6|nr:hypothetical protein [Candidatus Venteria ishoeyi]MDM8546388.1 hypothetical protein [Candidatus Venteria ishoeyi]
MKMTQYLRIILLTLFILAALSGCIDYYQKVNEEAVMQPTQPLLAEIFTPIASKPPQITPDTVESVQDKTADIPLAPIAIPQTTEETTQTVPAVEIQIPEPVIGTSESSPQPTTPGVVLMPELPQPMPAAKAPEVVVKPYPMPTTTEAGQTTKPTVSLMPQLPPPVPATAPTAKPSVSLMPPVPAATAPSVTVTKPTANKTEGHLAPVIMPPGVPPLPSSVAVTPNETTVSAPSPTANVHPGAFKPGGKQTGTESASTTAADSATPQTPAEMQELHDIMLRLMSDGYNGYE